MSWKGNSVLRIAGGFVAFILLGGLGNQALAQQADADAVSEGARVYGKTCGRCHNARSPLERDDRDWIVIANHMRVRGNLTGQEVRRVLAFLQATNTDPRERTPLPGAGPAAAEQAPELATGPVSTDSGVIANGKALLNAKACIGCHVVGSTGGPVGPTLNGILGRRTLDDVRRKLADPTFGNANSMMPNFGLTRDEIEAIVAYLATLRQD